MASAAPSDVEQAIEQECDALRDLLVEKNRAYGNSALDPLRVFSRADPEEQIRVRIDDKLSRLARDRAAGEDVELDLSGYLVLLRVARRLGITSEGTAALCYLSPDGVVRVPERIRSVLGLPHGGGVVFLERDGVVEIMSDETFADRFEPTRAGGDDESADSVRRDSNETSEMAPSPLRVSDAAIAEVRRMGEEGERMRSERGAIDPAKRVSRPHWEPMIPGMNPRARTWWQLTSAERVAVRERVPDWSVHELRHVEWELCEDNPVPTDATRSGRCLVSAYVRPSSAGAMVHATRDGKTTVCDQSIDATDVYFTGLEFFDAALRDGRGCPACARIR